MSDIRHAKSAIEAIPDLKHSGITYVSPSGTCELKKSESPIANHVLIEARGRETEEVTRGTYKSRLTDVALACGGAGLNYAAAAAACGSGAITLGVSSPLCFWSLPGAAVSAWQCGAALGQLYNHAKNPALADNLDDKTLHPHWHDLNVAIKTIGIVADLAALRMIGRDVVKLKSFGKLYDTSSIKRLSVAESKKIYRELAHVVDEKVLSNAELRNFLATRGYSRKYSMNGDVVASEIKRRLSKIDSFALGYDALSIGTEQAKENMSKYRTGSMSSAPSAKTAAGAQVKHLVHLSHDIR